MGRSPESIFDYLSGILDSTTWENKLTLLNISNRFKNIRAIKGEMSYSYGSLKNHFDELGLSPEQIIFNKTGVCFVDLVCSGGTFEQLFGFLTLWCQEEKKDINALKKKLRFIGITERKKNSPNTWRWQKHADWVRENPSITVKNISISCKLWDYLGNEQEKVTSSNHPEKWGLDNILLPPREERNLKALRLAYELFEKGKAGKEHFSEILATETASRYKWFRDLISEIRKRSKLSE